MDNIHNQSHYQETLAADELPFVAPSRQLPTFAAFDWLALAWRDFRATPGLSLLYGGILVAASYLVLQQIAAFLYSPGFAASPAVGTAGFVLVALLLTALAGVVLLQGSAPHSGFLRKLRVHLSQGLYINVFINRWLGAYRTGRISSE